ncbi:MAG TPA: ABC transporter ATP-binding protein [Fusobacterium sp.]|uniref:ABC transporter ATP-binding protein n=1 Tax=Fusobacterium sp. TaxID=68766 RepID=UPI002F4131C9
MKESYLKVENLSYSIESTQILKNISFEAKKGELIGIIGPNGSGKTSLLKNIGGIYKVEKGNILIAGKEIRSYEEKELAKKLAFMKQKINLSFDFSCLDVVMFGRYPHLKKFEDYREEDITISEKYMRQTNTISWKEKSILELSGGEVQRVIFAKILTQESDILLLDEPSSNLDMRYEEELFQNLQKQKEKLIITVIHNLRAAIRYCTRLILLSEGKIIKDGKPEEVITEELLKQVYEIEARIYRNPITGALDFCIL